MWALGAGVSELASNRLQKVKPHKLREEGELEGVGEGEEEMEEGEEEGVVKEGGAERAKAWASGRMMKMRPLLSRPSHRPNYLPSETS